jgi:CRP/FNR family cyclic AMP-dependent transcriptional regulator
MHSATWWRAFDMLPKRRVTAGAFVYLGGEAARSVYVLRSGLVKTSVVSRDGREFILRVARPGDLFGEARLAVSESGEHARALEASEIVEIPSAELLAQLSREPGALAGFIETLASRLADGHEAIRRLAFATAPERLCLALLELARDLGQDDGTATQIPHHITQEDLGRMTGARREVVSGLLNRLRERGVISYTRKGVIRVNRDALTKYTLSLSHAEEPGM